MSLPLKPIPVENGKGEPLKVCGQCFGNGTSVRAVEIQENPSSGETFRIGQYLDPRQVKLFRKKKWKMESYECKACGGAGMVKVSHG